ncbi:MAG: hypothetical protein Q9195_002805 [Heterodermia aff. obscurata]
MRLLSTLTLELHEFFDENTPPYAILSHTWENGEVSLQDLERHDHDTTTWAGYSKIKSCCQLAASEGWKFVWIDTCCIDKSSSAELSEAINSMFRWYQRAEVCYAYLSDVDVTGLCPPPSSSIRGSRWFTRGWTIQELLAPAEVIFYDKNWTEIGTKNSLQQDISSETGIKYEHLLHPMKACIAVKMSWASKRRTARREDIAYCLLGLFNLNMPLLYGEGQKAFFRLQYELLQSGGGDESIFAWEDKAPSPFSNSGILAPSPAAFASSGNIVLVDIPYGHRLMSNLTRKSMFVVVSRPGSLVVLRCKRASTHDVCLGIEIRRHPKDQYYLRTNPGQLKIIENPDGLMVSNNSRQAERSEEILLSFEYDINQYTLNEEPIIGVKWPALQVDPSMVRKWSGIWGIEMADSLNDGCWTFSLATFVHEIAMMFASSGGEFFFIIVQKSWHSVAKYSMNVVISDFDLAHDAWQGLRGPSSRIRNAPYKTSHEASHLTFGGRGGRGESEQDTFYGKLQRGSQLTVKLRKNVIGDHVCRMVNVDIFNNSSVFEFKDVQVLKTPPGKWDQ